jgi:hypothetical protein
MYLSVMKTITTIFLAVMVTPLFGQAFFDAGIKGAYGPTLMFNQNVFDDGTYDHVLNSGGAFGAKLGVHWANHHGVTFDYMRASSRQDFDLAANQQHEYIWKHNDLLLMYRYSGNGAYIEIGPKISFVSDVTSRLFGVEEPDAAANFVDNYKSVVFGFGSYLLGSDLVTLQAGVRLHWALDDMISEQGMEQGYPAKGKVFASYEKTKATAAQFSIELNYAFGRFAKASCSHRWRLILFE